MSLRKKYGTDASKVQEGVRFSDLPPNEDGTQPYFILSRASTNNPKYKKAMDKSMKPIRQHLRLKVDGHDTLYQDATLRAFCEGSILGWGNIKNSDVYGDEAIAPNDFCEYSVEAAVMMLKALPDLGDDLANFANDIANFQADEVDGDAKNS